MKLRLLVKHPLIKIHLLLKRNCLVEIFLNYYLALPVHDALLTTSFCCLFGWNKRLFWKYSAQSMYVCFWATVESYRIRHPPVCVAIKNIDDFGLEKEGMSNPWTELFVRDQTAVIKRYWTRQNYKARFIEFTAVSRVCIMHLQAVKHERFSLDINPFFGF